MIEPAIAPIVPRKLRRFQFKLSCMIEAPFTDFLSRSIYPGLSSNDRGDAVDFNQRISRQGSDRDSCARWATVGKISREHFVHSIPVFNFCEVDRHLKDGVRGSSANLHKLLNLVHDHGGMRFDCPFLGISTVVGTLTRDINQSVVDNHRHDDVFLAAWLTLGIQLTNSAYLRRGCLRRY